eukprot:gnl/TRDRNA2_/TRDRNA2_162217_c0_seq2.p2 gnl/TRDRNA2_/TRDRNA2_162217_c0~~gnl/TRDRNA2_/TRDRNA2_162217_c0_seq2.p2  ORF type:complete len:129 (-),score=27.02 gnl/TRDRNA2_/TRDRNA2_162217_c0_seq2:146-532(-)
MQSRAALHQPMYDGQMPLHIASQHGHVEMVRLLCEVGASKDHRMHDGRTASQLASQRGFFEIVQLLCSEESKKGDGTQSGRGSLHNVERTQDRLQELHPVKKEAWTGEHQKTEDSKLQKQRGRRVYDI